MFLKKWKACQNPFKLFMRNIELKEINNTKVLGLIVDSKLNKNVERTFEKDECREITRKR